MVLFAIQTCKSYASKVKGGKSGKEDDTLIIISFPHPQTMMHGEVMSVANDDDDSYDSAVDGVLASFDSYDSDMDSADYDFDLEHEEDDEEVDREVAPTWIETETAPDYSKMEVVNCMDGDALVDLETAPDDSKVLSLTSLAEMLETIRRRYSRSTRKLVLDVTLSMGWNAMLDTEWNWFVGTMGSCLVNLESLETRQSTHYSTEFLDDKKLQSLLTHLAPRIRHLHIGNTADYPRTFEKLGSLPSLQDLTIAKTSDDEHKRVTWQTWETLGRSLKALPKLERVTFDSIQFVEVVWDPPPTKQIWDPIISSLSQMRRLSHCKFDDCRVIVKKQGEHLALDGAPLTIWQESSYRKFALSEEEQRSISFFPRLNNDANLQYLLQRRETATVTEWVNALIAIRDRADCLLYLFKEVFDPATLARASLCHLHHKPRSDIRITQT